MKVLVVGALPVAQVGVAAGEAREPIPPCPHARPLCHEHVAGNSMPISTAIR